MSTDHQSDLPRKQLPSPVLRNCLACGCEGDCGAPELALARKLLSDIRTFCIHSEDGRGWREIEKRIEESRVTE